MNSDSYPLEINEFRSVVIKLVWNHSSWLERVFNVAEIFLTLKTRVGLGEKNILKLWNEVRRFAPKGKCDDDFFMAFVGAMPGCSPFIPLLTGQMAVEIERRKAICTGISGGMSIRLGAVSQDLASQACLIWPTIIWFSRLLLELGSLSQA